jgi:hypothetical protein
MDRTYVTKVSAARHRFRAALVIYLAVSCLSFSSAIFQPEARAQAVQPHQPGPAESLYLQLGRVGLDSSRVFKVRDSSIDRPSIHISLDDGYIAFTQDVLGRITGAFFEGDGEVLLVPPNEVERKSLSLFTNMAILEERFSTAYFRFNDNSVTEMQSGFRQPEDAAAFAARWNETAKNLAAIDAMRLLASFSDLLPPASPKADAKLGDKTDRLFHARIQGNTLGVFDVIFDSTAGEQVEAGQSKAAADGTPYYDVWTSFSPEEPAIQQAPRRSTNKSAHQQPEETLPAETESRDDPIFPRSYAIDASVKPPKELDAEVKMNLEVARDGSRFLVFELSRFLKVQTVEADGHAVEFIQNPAVEGTRLARSGNDLVVVILDQPVRKGQKIALRFVYGGEVLAEAGKGLLYVGARGNWYPNRGLAISDFDLTFHYPPGWTLVATGRPAPVSASPNASQTLNTEQVSRWISDRPLPVAGFDLGKYVRAAVQAGNVSVETYATSGVEKDFPVAAPSVEANPVPERRKNPPLSILPTTPSPARNAAIVAEISARAVRYYADHFGPFPYSQLALTQIPGRENQGWPGLIFLSSFAFLTPEERRQIHIDSIAEIIDEQVPAHEVAHQWWGDLIVWKTYRDQWFSEGLANYCSLMMLQEKNPEGFHEIMEKYRRDLVGKNKEGDLPKDAGPVTLGSRLLSSHFPGGYEAISYGRGTWLFHMLRTMLQDATREQPNGKSGAAQNEEPFMRALRKLGERYAGKTISTKQLLDVFAEDLPPSLRYEGKSSLDWFMEGWVNGTSLPKLNLQNVKFTPKGSGLTVTGVIRQEEAEKNQVTSVPIYGVASGRTQIYLGRVFADGAETTFHISAPAGTHKLLLDPYRTILTSPK